MEISEFLKFLKQKSGMKIESLRSGEACRPAFGMSECELLVGGKGDDAVACEYRGGGGLRREAEQADWAASAAAGEEAASAEANEAAGTAKPAYCLAVACDRVQARLERVDAKRTMSVLGSGIEPSEHQLCQPISLELW